LSQNTTIRRLRHDDSEAVRGLDRQILGPDRSRTWDQYVERFLAVSKLDSLILPPWGAHVAEADGRIVGFIFAERQSRGYGLPPGARIVAIAVHPDFRRSGIAGQLMERLCEECRGEGIDELYSVLRNEDERDQAFLRSAGFDDASIKVFVRKP
jgi:ribosomal protein S18 acetylase RimI-like enzyme